MFRYLFSLYKQQRDKRSKLLKNDMILLTVLTEHVNMNLITLNKLYI